MAGKNVLQNIDSTGTQFRPEYDERDLGECAHCVEREAPWASESASVGAPCIVSVLVFSGFIPGWWSVLMMHIVCSCFIQVRCTISAPRLRLGFLPNQGDVGMSRRSSPLRLFFAFLSLSWMDVCGVVGLMRPNLVCKMACPDALRISFNYSFWSACYNWWLI